ncbi:MAG: hypothetical protein RLZZ546_2922 [Bacteroidota bacterium]|jgi:prefoldin subunit 5
MFYWNKYILEKEYEKEDLVVIDGKSYIKAKMKIEDVLPASINENDVVAQDLSNRIEKLEKLNKSIQNLNAFLTQEILNRDIKIQGQEKK